MPFGNLLVHIDSSRSNDSRLQLALSLAKRFKAHLCGLYTEPSLNPVIYADGTALTGVYQEALEGIERDTVVAEKHFKERAKAEGIEFTWTVEKGRSASNLIEAGRYAELSIIGQDDPNDPYLPEQGVAEHVATEMGRPVLIVPYIGASDATGKCVLIAWDGSRESARAVNDAMPLLQTAEQVDVLHMYSDKRDSDSPSVANRLCEALARNDIEANAHEIYLDGLEVGDLLLSRAADLGSNLVVMGAYGHSRLRELVLGGATRDMLAHMTIPSLMSH